MKKRFIEEENFWLENWGQKSWTREKSDEIEQLIIAESDKISNG